MTFMTDDRLLEILSAYGASPLNWPEKERSDAEALLAANPDRFADAVREAGALDIELSTLPNIDLPGGLIESLIASAPIREEATQTIGHRPSGWRLPLIGSGFATACLSLGIAMGYALPAQADQNFDSSEVALTYALFDNDFSSFLDETDRQ